MKKRNFLLIFIFSCFSIQITAQENVSFKGKIIDASELIPVSNVSIFIENSTIGTITNSDGNFAIVIPKLLFNNNLIICHLSYTEIKIKISELSLLDTCIKINKKVFQLKEVEVTSTTPQEVLEKVISNLSRNYGAGPIILTGFLRSKKIVNDTLAAFSEAIFEDYKSGYFIYPKWGRFKKYDSTDIPRFIKGRSVIDTTLIKKLAEVEYFADPIWTAFGDPLECYRGSFLDPTEFKYYHYEQRDMIDESGNKIIKIMFDQKPGVKGHLPKGEIYIDPSVYAIRKIFLSSSPNGYEWYLKHNDESKGGWNQSVPVIQSIYTFNNCNGTWSLQSKAHYLYITYSNSLNNETLKYHREMELVIISNIRDSVKISTFDGDKKLGFNTYWEEIIEESDSNYWQNFNYIPIEEVLQNDIRNMSKHDEN